MHKGKPVNVQDVAREFGVDYVVEGSVRKAADRVRVTVQLIDAETDTHVWAERYDRQLADIFAIQDEVTSAIVSTLRGRVEAASQERAKRKPTDNMAAYEYVLTGKVLHHWSPGSNAEPAHSRPLIELDPNYAHDHAWKACVMARAGCTNGARRKVSVQQVQESCRSRSGSTTRPDGMHPRRININFATTTRRPITENGLQPIQKA